MKQGMVWNVYREDFNRREIYVFNVFEHGCFHEEVLRLLKKKMNRNEFSEMLKSIAMYYYSSKCEHEIIITSWPPYVTKEEIDRMIRNREERDQYRYGIGFEVAKKVDIYDQLNLNWNAFIDYVWEFKNNKER